MRIIYRSTCFGPSPAHHQELNDRSSSLWVYIKKLKPEAATAVIELLMMGGRTPETCWAVNKRQDNKLENCRIWLVIYLNCTMMHGPTNLKKGVKYLHRALNFLTKTVLIYYWLLNFAKFSESILTVFITKFYCCRNPKTPQHIDIFFITFCMLWVAEIRLKLLNKDSYFGRQVVDLCVSQRT